MSARLEHVNFTVPDPDATAAWLCGLLGWQVRWRGTAIHGGYSVHVGGPDSYLAIYSGVPGKSVAAAASSYEQAGGLNHIGIVVEDIEAVESGVRALGFTPHSHADYEPGRRFYFHDGDGMEYEIVSYA